jgi:Tfp pilus assembly protein PilF
MSTRRLLYFTALAVALALLLINQVQAANDKFSEEVWSQYMKKGAKAEKTGSQEQAEMYYRLALSEADKPQGEKDCVSDSLKALAKTCRKRNELDQAVSLYSRYLTLTEKRFGADAQQLDPILEELSTIYLLQRRYSMAVPLVERLLRMREQVLPPEDPKVISTQIYLTGAYTQTRQTADAERLCRRVVSVREQQHDASALALSLRELAEILSSENKWDQAEEFYKRQLAVLLKSTPADTPAIIHTLGMLGGCEAQQKHYGQAEDYFRKGLSLLEKQKEHTLKEVNQFVAPLGRYLLAAKKYKEAEVFLKRRLEIEKTLGGEKSHGYQKTLGMLVELYTQSNQPNLAKEFSRKMESPGKE